ncbi:MAG: RNA polymerase sigma factor [Acidobacteria bacterium]|nr:MAG: RNA polymerase sigma factor [Acidobacteriota bacterium]REJ99462.1 MAG: RNA polymerase sigma factor [Acidobacteriota bacterium]
MKTLPLVTASLSTYLCEPDRDVVSRARRGEHAALEQLYAAYGSALYTLARRICARDEDAEEVLQEVFLELHRSLRRYRPDGSFAVWLRRIAVNKAISRLRREKLRRHPSLDDEGEWREPEAGVRPAAHRVDLERALGGLPPLTRTVVWLHDVEGYTHREIGRLLGRTTSFSKSQLARAYVRLRAALATPSDAVAETGEVV